MTDLSTPSEKGPNLGNSEIQLWRKLLFYVKHLKKSYQPPPESSPDLGQTSPAVGRGQGHSPIQKQGPARSRVPAPEDSAELGPPECPRKQRRVQWEWQRVFPKQAD